MINNQNKPTIFGISIGKSFSDCFVEGFIKRFSGYEQQYISNITLYVNTNKMSENIKDSFLRISPGFLPKIYNVSDLRHLAIEASLPELSNPLEEQLELNDLIKVYLEKLTAPASISSSFDLAYELIELRKKLRKNILLVVDDAYAEYMRNSDYKSGLDLFKNKQNVFILRTFSKIYGLSSLRIGWGYGSKKIIDGLNVIKPPFNVNEVAQKAAIESLKDKKFISRSVKHNSFYATKLKDFLSNYDISSNKVSANFLLLNFDKCKLKAKSFYEKLKKKIGSKEKHMKPVIAEGEYGKLKGYEKSILQGGLKVRSGVSYDREMARLVKMYPGFKVEEKEMTYQEAIDAGWEMTGEGIWWPPQQETVTEKISFPSFKKKVAERKPEKAMDAGAKAKRKLARKAHAKYVSGSQDNVPDDIRDHKEYTE